MGILGPQRARLANGARRTFWAVASEAVHSANTLFLSAWIAHRAGAADFGAFTAIYAGMLFVMFLGRAACAMPMVIQHSGSAKLFERRLLSGVMGASCLVGVVSACLGLAVGFVIGGSVGQICIAIAVGGPSLLLQDSANLALYARGQARSAFTSNAIWAGVGISLFLIATYTLQISHAWPYVVLWDIAVTSSAIYGLSVLRTLPSVPGGVRRWVDSWPMARNLTTEAAIDQSSQQGVLWIMAVGLDLVSLAGFRAAQLIFGGVRILVQGLVPFGVAEGVKLFRGAPRRLLVLLSLWVLGSMVVIALLLLVLVSVPYRWGEWLLGESWSYSYPVLIPIAVGVIGNAIITIGMAGLRAMNETGTLVRLRIPVSMVVVLGAVIGVWSGNLRDFAIAYSSCTVCAGVLCAVVLVVKFKSVTGRTAGTPRAIDAG